MHFVGLSNRGSGPLDYTVSLDEPADWLGLEPRSGFLNPREFTQLILTFDTRGLEEGDYVRTIIIEDTLAQLSVELPVNLNVANDNGLDESPEVPLEWSLSQNYPNPFNASTTIDYSIKEPGYVEISVYDISGRLITKLINEEQLAGRYSLVIDRSLLPTGVYLYRLEAGSFTTTMKMIMLK